MDEAGVAVGEDDVADGRTAAPRRVPKLFAELESTTPRVWPAVVISRRPFRPSAKSRVRRPPNLGCDGRVDVAPTHS